MRKAKGVVAAGHRLTAEAAAEILADGGNAFDACHSGAVHELRRRGGVRLAGRRRLPHGARGRRATRSALYDAFADTPLHSAVPQSEVEFYAIEADFGPAKQEFHIGLGSSATPGVVPGFFALHARPLPTAHDGGSSSPRYARRARAFRLSEFQAYLFTVIAPILTASAGAAAIFAPEGKLLVGRRNLPQRGARRDA